MVFFGALCPGETGNQICNEEKKKQLKTPSQLLYQFSPESSVSGAVGGMCTGGSHGQSWVSACIRRA